MNIQSPFSPVECRPLPGSSTRIRFGRVLCSQDRFQIDFSNERKDRLPTVCGRHLIPKKTPSRHRHASPPGPTRATLTYPAIPASPHPPPTELLSYPRTLAFVI